MEHLINALLSKGWTLVSILDRGHAHMHVCDPAGTKVSVNLTVGEIWDMCPDTNPVGWKSNKEKLLELLLNGEYNSPKDSY